MHIQWFPGHMTKSLREMKENTKKVDIIIQLLDARAISSCFNEEFDKIFINKKVLYIINKIDLVDKIDLQKWYEYFKLQNFTFIPVSSTRTSYKNKIIKSIENTSKEIINFYKNKGVNKVIRAMVVGIPNSGKSTFINILAPSRRAETGNKAGVTRGVQLVRINNQIELFDTPGTLMPAFSNQEIATNLAFIGSINDDILDITELAINLLKRLLSIDKILLVNRYNVEITTDNPIDLLKDIAVKKGCILKGAKPDIERASKMIIDDFRKGRIGKIMLDNYEC